MNTPQGFTLKEGVFADFQPLVAMFNPATPTKVSHVLASSYTASAGLLAAIAAYSLLKGRREIYFKKALKLTVISTFVFAVSTAILGDFSGKFLAEYQPEKLAAGEWHFETTDRAPLIYGGVMKENGEIKYALKIPYALSILAGNSPNKEVIGLNDFPVDERPSLKIHYLFDAMVTIGGLLVVIPILYMFRHRLPRRRDSKKGYPKWLLICLVLLGPLAIVATELGWLYAEFGRQPWIVRGYMKVSHAATTQNTVGYMLILFLVLYIVLCFSCVGVLAKLFRNRDVIDEMRELGIRVEGGKRL
ncbi:putative cytochrome bd menaquinol oxidase subunit I [compost metagenome]